MIDMKGAALLTICILVLLALLSVAVEYLP